MKSVKNILSILAISLVFMPMLQAKELIFDIANESYSNESLKTAVEGGGTNYKIIESSGGTTMGAVITKGTPCYIFIELNLDEVRKQAGAEVSSAFLDVYTYISLGGDFTFYSVTNSANLTGDVVADWNAGNLVKSEDLLFTASSTAEELMQIDITDYVSGLLQDDTITFAGIAVANQFGMLYGNSSDANAIYNPKFVVTSEVPEPSTYAAIFGALVFSFVIYRRRR